MTQDELKQMLDYSPDTGEFTWLVSSAKRIKIGDIAGSPQSRGYRQIKINGKNYQLHRLVWLYVHGSFPTHCIDHINGVKHDNRLSNLREATSAENMQNVKRYKSNSSGFIGVVRYEQRNKWTAQIQKNGKRIFLGYFDTPEEAHDAYLKAKVELHTFNPIPR